MHPRIYHKYSCQKKFRCTPRTYWGDAFFLEIFTLFNIIAMFEVCLLLFVGFSDTV